MPTYVYKAVTKNGTIVKNKVEEKDRRTPIQKLKKNAEQVFICAENEVCELRVEQRGFG